MEKTRLLAYALVALIAADFALSVYLAYSGPFPAPVDLGSPTAFRNIFLHIPLAWTSLMLFTVTFVSALLYLLKGKSIYDRVSVASAAIGLVYAAATLVTGSAWAAESWEGVHIGFSWTWDPRETSVLLLFLAYIVYFIIRASIPDPDRAATLSNVYAIAAYAMVPLVFIAPKVAGVSLHPGFQTAGVFMRENLALFLPKVFLVSAVAAILTALAAAGYHPPRWLRYAVAILAAGYVAAALLLASPYLTAKLGYVESAAFTPSGAVTEVNVSLLNGGLLQVKLPKPVEPPFNPPLLKTRTGTVSSLVGHIVEVESLREGRIIVVTHWSVALSLALTGVSMLLGFLVVERVAKSSSEG